MSFERIGAADDLWSGEMRAVDVSNRAVLLVNVGGQVSAYEDRCCHKGLPLSAGRLQGSVLTCSAHGWQYDARTGCGINPRSAQLRAFPVKIENGQIWIEVGGER